MVIRRTPAVACQASSLTVVLLQNGMRLGYERLWQRHPDPLRRPGIHEQAELHIIGERQVPGLAPLRILSTTDAAKRKRSGWSAPYDNPPSHDKLLTRIHSGDSAFRRKPRDSQLKGPRQQAIENHHSFGAVAHNGVKDFVEVTLSRYSVSPERHPDRCRSLLRLSILHCVT
jgi:hypothetical protein